MCKLVARWRKWRKMGLGVEWSQRRWTRQRQLLRLMCIVLVVVVAVWMMMMRLATYEWWAGNGVVPGSCY